MGVVGRRHRRRGRARRPAHRARARVAVLERMPILFEHGRARRPALGTRARRAETATHVRTDRVTRHAVTYSLGVADLASYTLDNKVAVIHMDDGKANALSRPMIDAISAAL